ncbi:hypothetical protein BS47DRAFT_1346149 [Hydnum rufescens UP504]|uniref:coproporphyrinogen oxidase n=1 Tax=Hydnum rufescens UP504 TaxID=1448309 RepID=A0A9P6DVS7_9AGAM|nr:hypothetical protein BS47DRAFT_1346149 [Hydnum rufescens UP504]
MSGIHDKPSVDFLSPAVPMRDRMTAYAKDLQERIIHSLESLDQDPPSSATIASGSVLEKAGVNISSVHGKLPPRAIEQMRADHAGIPYDLSSGAHVPFFAAGISIVLHPRNPNAPTRNPPPPGKVLAWWFGGGSDLTPSYLFEEDAKTFHGALKSACDPFGTAIYPAFKSWCDEYFHIPHREETRGIGGIFFDDFSYPPHKRLPPPPSSSSSGSSSQGGSPQRPHSADEIFAFIRSCGDAFIPSYIPILARRKDVPYTDHMRRWQLLRRGRYVEFNLIYDRGTKFGLKTPGPRIESILMSLPETARWEYRSDMGEEEGSEEKKLLDILKSPKDWI